MTLPRRKSGSQVRAELRGSVFARAASAGEPSLGSKGNGRAPAPFTRTWEQDVPMQRSIGVARRKTVRLFQAGSSTMKSPESRFSKDQIGSEDRPNRSLRTRFSSLHTRVCRKESKNSRSHCRQVVFAQAHDKDVSWGCRAGRRLFASYRRARRLLACRISGLGIPKVMISGSQVWLHVFLGFLSRLATELRIIR